MKKLEVTLVKELNDANLDYKKSKEVGSPNRWVWRDLVIGGLGLVTRKG